MPAKFKLGQIKKEKKTACAARDQPVRLVRPAPIPPNLSPVYKCTTPALTIRLHLMYSKHFKHTCTQPLSQSNKNVSNNHKPAKMLNRVVLNSHPVSYLKQEIASKTSPAIQN